jgi:hypothetical protein
MCAFLLLAGARRHVPPEARVLVHQIWPRTKRDDATAATYSAEDLVRTQRELGRLARYIVEMGGDIELFELAMRIPPWERLRPLSPDDLRRMQLHTVANPFAPVAPDQVVTIPDQAEAKPTIALESQFRPERRWMLSEKAGLPALTRRNPLTIEGEPMGSFELSLSCGDAPGSYTIGYSESRHSGSRLTGAVVVLGRERALLKLNPAESIGHGTLPAAALEAFSSGTIKTLVVATRTADDTRSSIRVGNTGFAQIFPQMSGTCAR